MKYIDADNLIAEINNKLMSVNLEELGNFGCHRVWAYNDVKDLITYLQQEQPEVDLDKEVQRWKNKHGVVGMDDLWLKFALCIYELGLNARK